MKNREYWQRNVTQRTFDYTTKSIKTTLQRENLSHFPWTVQAALCSKSCRPFSLSSLCRSLRKRKRARGGCKSSCCLGEASAGDRSIVLPPPSARRRVEQNTREPYYESLKHRWPIQRETLSFDLRDAPTGNDTRRIYECTWNSNEWKSEREERWGTFSFVARTPTILD